MDVVRRLLAKPAPALPPYHQSVAPLRHALLKTTVVGLIILLGMIYGFLISIFPLFLYLYLAVPVGVLALVVIWVLPESDTVPKGAIRWLLFAVFATGCIWPNYLAIAIPGLPWITIVRLWAIPMTLLFVISLSMSKRFRHETFEWTSTNPWVLWGMLVYVALGLLTIPMSNVPFGAFNRFIINQFEWTAVFFVACYVFRKEGYALRWAWAFSGLAIFLAVTSIAEFVNGRVPWANHIPSFIQVQGELVQAILIGGSRSATGAYRIQSIFSTSLNFSEFLALSTPFVIHFIMTTKRQVIRLGLLAYLPFSFWVIFTTDSRLGVIGFFASLFLYGFFWGVKKWMHDRHTLIAPTVVLAYPAVIAAFIGLSLVWRRLEVMMWGGGPQQASNIARQFQWTSGMNELKQWPFGYGIGQAGEIVGYYDQAGRLSLDSYYLTVLLDLGVAGFIAYFGMFLFVAWKSIKLSIETQDPEIEVLLPLGIMLGVFVIIKGVLGQEDNHTLVFVALGAAVALINRVAANKSAH